MAWVYHGVTPSPTPSFKKIHYTDKIEVSKPPLKLSTKIDRLFDYLKSQYQSEQALHTKRKIITEKTVTITFLDLRR